MLSLSYLCGYYITLCGVSVVIGEPTVLIGPLIIYTLSNEYGKL